jgi:hypothetical protein
MRMRRCVCVRARACMCMCMRVRAPRGMAVAHRQDKSLLSGHLALLFGDYIQVAP